MLLRYFDSLILFVYASSDELAEVEPSTRGFKLPQDHSPFIQEFSEEELVDDDISDKANSYETPYLSNGFDIDKKKVFAIQHRGKCFLISDGLSIKILTHGIYSAT